MLTIAFVLAVTTFVGHPVARLFDRDSDFLLAPAVGLASVIALGYLISANAGVSGADGMAVAGAVLTCAAISFWCVPGVRRRMQLSVTRSDTARFGLAMLPAAILLGPAFSYGIANFFGAINFDFFYNSQDAAYLATHTVYQYSDLNQAILPLGGSADAQGRFAVGLVGAFASKFFGANTVHFNAELISALLAINALAFVAFADFLFGKRSFASFCAGAVVLLSAGFAQGYVYFLLGQISAIPMLVAGLICLGKALRSSTTGELVPIRTIVALAFWLNALYITYAILSAFLAAFIVVGFVFLIMLDSREKRLVHMRSLAIVIAASLIAYVAVRLTAIAPTIDSIQKWISLSFQTAVDVSSRPKILGEYIIEPFLALLLGIASYPTSESVIGRTLPYPQTLPMLLFGIVALVGVAGSVVSYVRHRADRGAVALVLSLFCTTMISALTFFATSSGYSVFKLSTWFAPLFLPVVVFAMTRWKRGLAGGAVALLGTFVVGANVASGISYVYAFAVPSMAVRLVNAPDVNGLPGVEELGDSLDKYPDSPVALDLKNGLRMAWVANELQRPVTAVTHNFQPLADREIPPDTCPTASTVSEDAIVVVDSTNNDVLATPFVAPLMITGPRYNAFRMSDAEMYAYLGRGTYTPDHLSPELSQATGLPQTFRWVEHGFELFLFSRTDKLANIVLEVYPGFASSSPDRSISLKTQETEQVENFSKQASTVKFHNLPIRAGLNCFFIESKDPVEHAPRYGALLRQDTQNDFRLLNYALGSVRFEPVL